MLSSLSGPQDVSGTRNPPVELLNTNDTVADSGKEIVRFGLERRISASVGDIQAPKCEK